LAALRGLASIDARLVASDNLVATLEDADPGVRRAAASLLGCHPETGTISTRVIGALVLALYDEDEGVRLSAADALGATSDDRAVLSLIRAAGDASPAVRDAAAQALRSILGDEVDTVAAGEPVERRVEALKAWWRSSRVRLRVGGGGESVDVGGVAKEIIQTIAATTKGETVAVSAAQSAPTPPRRADVPPVVHAAPPVGVAAAAAASTPGARKPEPAAESTVKGRPEASPEPKPEEAPAQAEESAAAEGEGGDFESIFNPSEADENQEEGGDVEPGGEDGDGGDGGYENVL
jgi:hypothetical protein